MVPKVFSGIKHAVIEGIHLSAEKEARYDKQEKRIVEMANVLSGGEVTTSCSGS